MLADDELKRPAPIYLLCVQIVLHKFLVNGDDEWSQ